MAIILVLVVILFVALSHPSPISTRPVDDYIVLEYEWTTPPGGGCTTFGMNNPAPPFQENASQTFNVSWYETCTTGGPMTISGPILEEGGTLVSTNLPVTFVSGSYVHFNATILSPSEGYRGPLVIDVTATVP